MNKYRIRQLFLILAWGVLVGAVMLKQIQTGQFWWANWTLLLGIYVLGFNWYLVRSGRTK